LTNISCKSLAKLSDWIFN